MTNHTTTADRTIRRTRFLATTAIAAVLIGGCSQADVQNAELKSEIEELRESLEATTERARLEQQRSAGRGAARVALLTFHWELMAEQDVEKTMVGELSDAIQTEQFEWSFISAFSRANAPPRDEFESDLLKRFATSSSAESKAGGQTPFSERRSPIDGRYEYYEPSFYKKDCFACHSGAGRSALTVSGGDLTDSEPYAEGDLIAIIKIRLKE